MSDAITALVDRDLCDAADSAPAPRRATRGDPRRHLLRAGQPKRRSSACAAPQLLYPYCEAHGVEHRRCGKLIVAHARRGPAEARRHRRAGCASGVFDLRGADPLGGAGRWSRRWDCVSALWSPSTGIIDSHGFMTALLGDAERGRRRCWRCSRRCWGRAATAMPGRSPTGGAEALELEPPWIVNAAGLHAPVVAQRIARFSAGGPCRHCISPRATISRCAAARRSRA